MQQPTKRRRYASSKNGARPNNSNGRALDATLGIKLGVPIEFDLDAVRPRTRAECVLGFRPCPWVGCRHHLALDVNPETGSISLCFPDLDIGELADTCSLDVADRGPNTLEQVGSFLNVTRERCRQIENTALVRSNAAPLIVELRSA